MNVFGRGLRFEVRIAGVLLALAVLFSGDLVRIHGHPDGAPSADCVACVAGLAAAVEAGPPPAVDPPRPSFVALAPAFGRLAPALPFARQGGLRDPPAPSA